MMQLYKNLSGDSTVYSYETGADYITVKFEDGEAYRYDYETTGRQAVEAMKELAEKGKGLNTYIFNYTRKTYAEKLA